MGAWCGIEKPPGPLQCDPQKYIRQKLTEGIARTLVGVAANDPDLAS